MVKEATLAVIQCLEKIDIDKEKDEILRLQYLRLAILSWKMDRNNPKEVIKIIEKARINYDIFKINEYVTNIIISFLEPLRLNKANKGYYINHIEDVTLFFRSYIERYLSKNPEKYLTYLISRCFFELSMIFNSPFLFLKGILNDPIYFLNLVFQSVKSKLKNIFNIKISLF